MVGLGREAIFLFPSFKCWDTRALEIVFLSRDPSQDGALHLVVSLLFERWGGGREGQGNGRRTHSSGCDREGMNGHECVSPGVQRLQSYRLLTPVLFYEGKGHMLMK